MTGLDKTLIVVSCIAVVTAAAYFLVIRYQKDVGGQATTAIDIPDSVLEEGDYFSESYVQGNEIRGDGADQDRADKQIRSLIYLGNICGTCGNHFLFEAIRQEGESRSIELIVGSNYTQRDIRNLRENLQLGRISIFAADSSFESIEGIALAAQNPVLIPFIELKGNVVINSGFYDRSFKPLIGINRN